MKIVKDKLTGDGVTFTESPNQGAFFAENLPDTIILHYTAGRSAQSSVKTLCNPKTKASAHLVVGRDGSVFQLIPFNRIAWHAGRSAYGNRIGFNKYSLGIEIDNAGILSECVNGYTSWFGKVYPESEVMRAVHRNQTEPKYWHIYSEEQIERVYDICLLLSETYAIKSILGHEEIAPARKTDPGPAFPLDKLRNFILAFDRDEDGPEEEISTETPGEGVVTAGKLNIRSEPTASSSLAGSPLVKGTAVEILQEINGWYEVNAVVNGWVKKDYIDEV